VIKLLEFANAFYRIILHMHFNELYVINNVNLHENNYIKLTCLTPQEIYFIIMT